MFRFFFSSNISLQSILHILSILFTSHTKGLWPPLYIITTTQTLLFLLILLLTTTYINIYSIHTYLHTFGPTYIPQIILRLTNLNTKEKSPKIYCDFYVVYARMFVVLCILRDYEFAKQNKLRKRKKNKRKRRIVENIFIFVWLGWVSKGSA